MPKAEKLSVTRTPSVLGVSVETLVEGLPRRRSILRLFVSKDGGVRRPGGDKEEEAEPATVSLVPLTPSSGLVSAGLSAPSRMGSRSGAKRLTASGVLSSTRENPAASRWSQRRPPSGEARSSMIPPSLKASVTLPSAVRFSAHVRRPESLKRFVAPKKDTVQCYTEVGLVQVAAP